MPDQTSQAAANISVFNADDVVAVFERDRTAFVGDIGEQEALIFAAPTVRGTPLLDVGVGGGRTTALLRLLSEDYIGLDAAPQMVAQTRAAFPDLDIRLADARALPVEDDSVNFALFSFNGIDAVDHDDRHRVLAELSRAVRPGGLVLYSTLNMAGPSFRETPWRYEGDGLRSAGKELARQVTRPGRLARSVGLWWRMRKVRERHDTWATSALRTHEFRLLVHFVDVPSIPSELAAVGLEPVAVFTREGARLPLESLQTTSDWVHVLARPVSR